MKLNGRIVLILFPIHRSGNKKTAVNNVSNGVKKGRLVNVTRSTSFNSCRLASLLALPKTSNRHSCEILNVSLEIDGVTCDLLNIVPLIELYFLADHIQMLGPSWDISMNLIQCALQLDLPKS